MLNGGPEGDLCHEPRCKTKHGKEHCRCYKHMMRRWRKANPMRAAYVNLRESARQREIEFSISFIEFQDFALQCEYLSLTGNNGDSLTVDRKNNLIGYQTGNIQPMTRAANTIKQAKQDQRRMEAGMRWKSKQRSK